MTTGVTVVRIEVCRPPHLHWLVAGSLTLMKCGLDCTLRLLACNPLAPTHKPCSLFLMLRARGLFCPLALLAVWFPPRTFPLAFRCLHTFRLKHHFGGRSLLVCQLKFEFENRPPSFIPLVFDLRSPPNPSDRFESWGPHCPWLSCPGRPSGHWALSVSWSVSRSCHSAAETWIAPRRDGPPYVISPVWLDSSSLQGWVTLLVPFFHSVGSALVSLVLPGHPVCAALSATFQFQQISSDHFRGARSRF